MAQLVKNPPANGGKLGRNGLHIVPGLHTDFQQVIKLIHRGQDSLSSGPTDWCLYSHTEDWDTNKLKKKGM